ncbi:MAG: bacillithiol biosynthesis deacetylase BshB1 [Planctomycetota bacterium]|nr:MAG: bacillithiol biosynthesis deacetylase BshB1 [Planctomycetota bacterium]
MKLDAIVIAAHPDDAEISVGGTILKLVRSGRKVGIVDVTRGEMGTRGDRATRAAEASAASELMGLAMRANLELPDGRVVATPEAREALAAIFRRYRPEVVLAHHLDDLHPDHIAAGRLARDAWYLSGLARLAAEDGGPPAHRPRRIYHFMSHLAGDPAFVIDVTPVWDEKVRLVSCYASQLEATGPDDDGSHLLFGANVLERMETKARYFGERIGVRYGEPLIHVGPVALEDPLVPG